MKHPRYLLLCLTALVAFSAVSTTYGQSANLPVHRNGGVAPVLSATKVTAAYTIRDDEAIVIADPTASAFTLTLPSPKHGRTVVIKNAGDGTYGVTLVPPGTTTIEGASTYTVASTLQSVTAFCYAPRGGTAVWYVIDATRGSGVQARTATADGTTTGTISADATHVTVTSDDANKIIILPAPVVGKQIVIHNGATGYELRSTDPATIAINGGTGSAAESAIAANSTCVMVCVTSTAWKGYFMAAAGTLSAVQAAAP
jgi:hypothetical protein